LKDGQNSVSGRKQWKQKQMISGHSDLSLGGWSNVTCRGREGKKTPWVGVLGGFRDEEGFNSWGRRIVLQIRKQCFNKKRGQFWIAKCMGGG